jgi:hypothetical protein
MIHLADTHDPQFHDPHFPHVHDRIGSLGQARCFIFVGNASIEDSKFDEVNTVAYGSVMNEGESIEDMYRRLTALPMHARHWCLTRHRQVDQEKVL